MATVAVDQMRDELLTLDQVREKLSTTEPLSTEHLSAETKISFKLDPGWETQLDALEDTDPADAIIRVNGKDHRLTKGAALQAAASFGIPGAYVKKTPAKLIETLLNYHFSGGIGSAEFKALSVGDNVAAFTRPTIVPFSNLQLLAQAETAIRERYGADAEILADYKIQNSLKGTDIRLIVPEHVRSIANHGMNDVPEGEGDIWSAGIHLSNSLIGKRQTAVEAYLFRWWCTNGCTVQMPTVGKWGRRTEGQETEDVLDWARKAVDDVLGGMESKFTEVQALTQLNVGRNVGDIVRQIFTDYSVPLSQRSTITQTLLDADALTMYTVMNAITRVANDPEISPERADKLMRIGGAIPTKTFDTMKAQIWTEGHTADPTEPNPYVVTPVEV